MNYLFKNYYESCKATFSQYGFKKKNGAFARVVNDIMQNFAIEKLKSGRACRVEFAIIPLCLRIEKEYISGGVYSHYLKKFEIVSWTLFDSWEYDKNSEASMDACLEEIMRYLTSYLLPFFERANSCETALPELIKLERLFNDNRMEILRISGIEDRADPGTEFLISDCVKYYMALKNGDYGLALKSRQALLQQNLDAYNSMAEGGYLTEENRMRREKGLETLRDEIDHLSANDIGYFQRLLEENEVYSRENLKGFV